MSKGKILFQLTGSISCYKACYLISKLVQAKYEVQTVATDAALKFVGEATLEGLTDRQVYKSMFGDGLAKAHISLADWADLMLLCPASANTINGLASGMAESLVGALFLANNFRKPYMIAPAMNSNMYEHPATQDSLKKLEKWGCKIYPTEEGMLACGAIGKGRLIDPEVIFKDIEARFS